MKIFVVGGTGALGRRVVPLLVDGGFEVTAVSRREESDRQLASRGAQPVRLDVFDSDAVVGATAGYDIVMNLATAIPSPRVALRRSTWAETIRLRDEGARNLATAAIRNGATRFVQESLALAYPDRGSDWIDENTPLDRSGPPGSARAAEAAVSLAVDAGLDGVALRFGSFYAADTVHTRLEISLARRGYMAVPGRGDAYRTMIHLDDAAAAVIAALELPSGAYNVSDDTPLTRAEHAAVLGSLLRGKPLRLAPSVMGSFGLLSILARSQRTTNAKLRGASGWRPRYPSAQDGWEKVLAEHTAEVTVDA